MRRKQFKQRFSLAERQWFESIADGVREIHIKACSKPTTGIEGVNPSNGITETPEVLNA